METIRIEDFPDELYEAIEEQAQKNGRTISEEVIEALRSRLLLTPPKRPTFQQP